MPPTGVDRERTREHLWCVGLLASLDRSVFRVTPDHYLRVERLLDHIGPQSSVERLRTLIAPLIVTSAEQQKRFDDAFANYVKSAAWVEERPTQFGTETITVPVLPSSSIGATVPPEPKRLTRVQKLFVALVTIAIVLAIGRWVQVTITKPEPPPPVDTTRTDPPTPDPLPPAGTETQDRDPIVLPVQFETLNLLWLAEYADTIRYAAVGLPFIVFGLLEWRRRRRRQLVAERAAQAGPPLSLKFTISRPTTGPFSPDEMHRTAREVRRRQRSAVMNLSIPRSVTATVEGLGFPSLVFAPATRPPEYVVLIERTSPWDHEASLFESIVDRLDEEGAIINRYSYEGDPRLSFPKGSRNGVWLEDLFHLHADARLVVVGSGRSFVDPFTGGLADWISLFYMWDERAFLSTVVPADWNRREAMLAREFIVLPATLDGLRATSSYFDSGGRPHLRDWRRRLDAQAPPDAHQPTSAAELKRYFSTDAGFRWLCACAVYPELRWDLTLHLATIPSLRATALTEENLLRLVALPWFKRGAFPDGLRLELLDALAEIDRVEGSEIEREARSAVNTILETPSVAPAGSVANERRERERLVNELYLHRDDKDRARKIAKTLRERTSDGELARDAVVVKMVSRAGVSRLTHVLPENLRRLLYVGGQSSLGVRSGATLLAAVVLATTAFFVSPRPEDLALELASFVIEPSAALTKEGQSATFVATGTLRDSSAQAGGVVQWDVFGGSRRVLDTLNASGDGSASNAFESTLTNVGYMAFSGSKDANGLPGVGVNLILASYGESRARAKMLVDSARNFGSYPVQVLMRPRLVEVGVPSGFQSSVDAIAGEGAGKKFQWRACGGSATMSESGVFTARRRGWFMLRAAQVRIMAYLPVYAAERTLSASEQQLLVPVDTGDADRGTLLLGDKVRALAASPMTALEVYTWSLSDYAQSGNSWGTIVRNELLSLGATEGAVRTPAFALDSLERCVRSYMPPELIAEMTRFTYFGVVDTPSDVPSAIASDTSSAGPTIPTDSVNVLRALVGPEFGAIWTGADREMFAFILRLRSPADSQVTGTIAWTLINPGARADLIGRVGTSSTDNVAGTFHPDTRRLDMRTTRSGGAALFRPIRYQVQFDSTLRNMSGQTVDGRVARGTLRGSARFLAFWQPTAGCAAERPMRSSLSVRVGESISIPRQGYSRPQGQMEPNVRMMPWSSDDTSVVVVGADGNLGGRAPGRAVARLRCLRFTDSVVVTVSFAGAQTAPDDEFSKLPTSIYFEYDEATISNVARPILDSWAKALGTDRAVRIRIEGHTDDQRDSAYNRALGRRYADAVRQFLLERGGAADRIQVVSFGDERPACREPTAACRAQNRRVEIRVTGRGAAPTAK